MSENLNDWMDEVLGPENLPNGKGTIAAIHPPKEQATKHGTKRVCQFVINGSDGSTVNSNVFLPEQFPAIHPDSNLGKIMSKYGAKDMKDLIGKEVEVESKGMFWNIKV